MEYGKMKFMNDEMFWAIVNGVPSEKIREMKLNKFKGIEENEWYKSEKFIISSSIEFEKLHDYGYIYFLLQENEVVYVGQTVNLHTRIKNHKKTKEFNKINWIQIPIKWLEYAETYYIIKFNPKYNKSKEITRNLEVFMLKLMGDDK